MNAEPASRERLVPRLHRPYFRLARHLRANRALHRGLFGFIPQDQRGEGRWDWTTLVLRGVLRRRLRPPMRYLDLGCGPWAVLAAYAALRLGCREVWAVDHLPPLVAAARRTLGDLDLTVHLLAGDLCSALNGSFDLITFNAPYIEPGFGRQLGVLRDAQDERRFSGGAGGTETIRRFLLQCPEHLNAQGLAALGANSFYLKPQLLESLIPGNGLRLSGRVHHRLTRSYALLLERDR